MWKDTIFNYFVEPNAQKEKVLLFCDVIWYSIASIFIINGNEMKGKVLQRQNMLTMYSLIDINIEMSVSVQKFTKSVA